MDTNTHSNLFAVLAINTDPAPSVNVHALDDTDSPFLYAKTSQCPPEHFPGHMVECFLKIHIMLVILVNMLVMTYMSGHGRGLHSLSLLL